MLIVFAPELNERQTKIAAFNSLVHRLPRPNLALLRALVQFLIVIVNNSDVNKMTVRNVGIVFAPTLNIPAPVFSMFLTEFERIFEDLLGTRSDLEDPIIDSPTSPEISHFAPSQMLTEMPSLHTQTTFRKQGDPRDRDECITHQSSYDQSSSNFLESNNEEHTTPPTTSKMLTPNPETSRSIKSKRRESSLLFMEVNHLSSPFASAHDNDGE